MQYYAMQCYAMGINDLFSMRISTCSVLINQSINLIPPLFRTSIDSNILVRHGPTSRRPLSPKQTITANPPQNNVYPEAAYHGTQPRPIPDPIRPSPKLPVRNLKNRQLRRPLLLRRPAHILHSRKPRRSYPRRGDRDACRPGFTSGQPFGELFWEA